MITRRQALVQTCSALLGLALPRWSSGQNGSARDSASATAAEGVADLQIQSSVLRIEFDHYLRSRVVALLGPNPKVLAGFSASETVTGIRTWSDFALSASRRERVSDAFGAGERLSLTGKSGDLRKDISVTIYSEFPSFAVAYTLTRSPGTSLKSSSRNV